MIFYIPGSPFVKRVRIRRKETDPQHCSTTHLIITQHNFTSLLQSFEIQVIYFICYRKALEKAYGPLHASMTDKQVYALRKLERKLFNAWCRSAICLSIYLIYLSNFKIQNPKSYKSKPLFNT